MTLDQLRRDFEEERKRFAAYVRSQSLEAAMPLASIMNLDKDEIYEHAYEEEAEINAHSHIYFLKLSASAKLVPLAVAVWKKAMVLHIAETDGLDAAMLWKLQQH